MPSKATVEENAHLSGTLKLLQNEKANLSKQVKNLEEKYAEGLKKASQEGRQDDAVEEIKQINEMMYEGDYVFKRRFLERLDNQISTPYFARIDFLPTNSSKTITVYIGKYAYIPDNFDYRISDWRAPISSVYYNYTNPTKGAFYEFVTPVKHRPWLSEKRKIVGDLILRRNIEIFNGEILGIYDNNLRIDLLTSELSRKSGGKLEDIVKTIQSEQDEIIRADPNNVVVVQGTAGSGKTTVAIHRMSYLFYTYKDYLKEENTLLISSSKVLINYVAQTLPELEIYSLERSTLHDYILKIFNEYGYVINEKTITNINNPKPELRNSEEFLSSLKIFVQEKRKEILYKLKILANNPSLQIEKYLSRFNNYAPYEIIETLIQNYTEDLSELIVEKKNGNFTVEKKISELEFVIKKLALLLKEYEPVNSYKDFLSYFALNTQNRVALGNKIDLHDLSAIYVLGKYLRGIRPRDKIFKHVVVDEAQEMGLLNLYAVKTLCENGGFTLLGDLNQSSDDGGNIQSWDDLKLVWQESEIKYFEIKVSYRTTKQIISFAKKILQKYPQFIHLPEPFDRDGKEVEKNLYKTRKDLLDKLNFQIQHIRKSGDQSAIGIIEFDPNKIPDTSKILSELGIQNKIIDQEFDEFDGSGVYVVSPDLVKGLEFNSVFIIDPNEKVLQISPKSAKKLFVAVTRAINNLYIMSIEKENELLDDI